MPRVKVKAIVNETSNIRSLLLGSADGTILPAVVPGAHIDVYLSDSLVRQYSLCNGPQDDCDYQIAVKLDPLSRGGSLAMHRDVRVGDELQISTPRCQFVLAETALPKLLIAGGIGITPLLSMARHLAAQRRRFELHYFVRSNIEVAFQSVLDREDLCRSTYIHCGLDRDSTREILTRAIETSPPDAEIYTCGPAGLMNLVERIARGATPPRQVTNEHFRAADAPTDATDHAFLVQLASTAKQYHVPADQCITEALASQGIVIATSCKEGLCGTCVTTVLHGEPDHRDFCLSEEEREVERKFCPCVSRSFSPVLILDR